MVRNDRVTVWLVARQSDLARKMFEWRAVRGGVYMSLAGTRSPRGEIRPCWKREVGTAGGPLFNQEMREGRVVRVLDDGTVRIRLDHTGRRIRATPED